MRDADLLFSSAQSRMHLPLSKLRIISVNFQNIMETGIAWIAQKECLEYANYSIFSN